MNYLLFVYFVLHLVFTWAMTSVSWFIDLIHYPGYRLVSKKRFKEFEVTYLKKSVYLIIPLMVVEGITSILLWYKSYNTALYYPAFINFLVLVVTWFLGFRYSLKYHRKLAEDGVLHTKTFVKMAQMHRYRAMIWGVRALGLLFFGLRFF